LEGLAIEDSGIFYVNLVNFTGILVYFLVICYISRPFWYILWLFGIFPPIWNVAPRKIWQPCFYSLGSKKFYLLNVRSFLMYSYSRKDPSFLSILIILIVGGSFGILSGRLIMGQSQFHLARKTPSLGSQPFVLTNMSET
jgi:hypothetical protein